MKKNIVSKTNYTFLGKPMSEEELMDMINTSENGKFHSMEEFKKKISEWKLILKKLN
jgi:hypothetical protein